MPLFMVKDFNKGISFHIEFLNRGKMCEFNFCNFQ